MVKTKFSAKILAVVLVISMLISVFACALTNASTEVPTQVSAAETREPGIYLAGTNTLVKSWADMIAESYVYDCSGTGAGVLYVYGHSDDYPSEELDLICDNVPGVTINNFYVRYINRGFAGENVVYVDLSRMDLSNYDPSSDGGCPFEELTSLRKIKMPNKFKTITNYDGAVGVCLGNFISNLYTLEEVDWGNFDTSNVISINNLFSGCTSLKKASLKGFTSKLTSALFVFDGCEQLEEIDLNGSDWSNCELSISNVNSLKRIKMPSNILSGTINLNASSGYHFATTDAPTVNICDNNGDFSSAGYKGKTIELYDSNNVSQAAPDTNPGGNTPSTGVVTDMLGLVVTAVIVMAICVVATRKKKVQH